MSHILSYRLPDEDRRALELALAGGPTCFDLLPPGAMPFVAWWMHEMTRRTVLWVVDSQRTLDLLEADAMALAPERAADLVVFPMREPADRALGLDRRRAIEGRRWTALLRCRQNPLPAVVLTCVPALLQPTVPPDVAEAWVYTVAVGDRMGIEEAKALLQQLGYEWVAQVEVRGQAAVRGGIVDVWPPSEPEPIRIEWLGARVESIRVFDPGSQVSHGPQSQVTLVPAREPDAPHACWSDHVPRDAIRVWYDPDRLREAAERHRCAEPETSSNLERSQLPILTRSSPKVTVPLAPAVDLVFSALGDSTVAPYRLGIESVEPFETGRQSEPDRLTQLRGERVRAWLARARRGGAVHWFFATEGTRQRFQELYGELLRNIPNVHMHVAPLSGGFALADGSLTVVTESDLFPARRTGWWPVRRSARTARAAPVERMADPGRMEPGELVVHADHGIGRYLGLMTIRVGDSTQEVLAVEYAEGARLYVPLDQAHRLSRYVGAGGPPPELHRLGGRRWALEKERAERATSELAARLLETQAWRQIREGRAWAPDGAWQHEFEAAFPFVETEDQRRAIEEVKRDLESPRPMDRLVCGDVGYGKTEVAMRAAFKVVADGGQVAVLVPTTVLAQQHYDTFRERMAAFPIVVEMLSRFRTRSEQRRVLDGLAAGRVDIVIGTHRLLQPDVRFQRLGLVIIDEEQRFGVEHKERLKRWNPTVDVLCLTATPIPRTLYLSLVGVRDLSVIETPPQDRLPIETIIRPWDDRLIREAILWELDRGGQVFFLHNRVATIGHRLAYLRQLVPEARIEYAHGQMGERELAEILHRFAAGQFDVLLCTTIMESGIDMPRVNTILIERADRFGLADLYQLRGRVGRYRYQARAYLLLPRHGRLLDTARQRIAALRRHSGLGAGFRLALRDLEARGAGNILGAEQSGHIAAVGFDLYCQLLRRAVARLRGEPLPEPATARLALDFIRYTPDPVHADEAAAIPADYIEDEPLRLEVYRRIAGAVSAAELDTLSAELTDRFGPVPAPVRRLLELTRLKILLSRAGIELLETRGDRALFYRNGEPVMIGQRLPRLRSVAVDERITELQRWARRLGHRMGVPVSVPAPGA